MSNPLSVESMRILEKADNEHINATLYLHDALRIVTYSSGVLNAIQVEGDQDINDWAVGIAQALATEAKSISDAADTIFSMIGVNPKAP